MILNTTAARIPLADASVHCGVTSPPYYGLRLYAGLEPQIWGGVDGCEHEWEAKTVARKNGGKREYGSYDNAVGRGPGVTESSSDTCRLCGAWRGHLGHEPTPEAYIAHLVEVGREMWRVLRDDGVWFLNLGDSYANDTKWGGTSGNKNYTSAAGRYEGQRAKRSTGLKPKDKILIPHRVALALQADGWTLRQDMCWLKWNPMPESVTDRPTTAHEYIFVLTKSVRVYWDNEAVKRVANPDSIARQKRGVGSDHKNTNGAPGQPAHTFSQFRENDPGRQIESTRQFRTTDLCLDSLDLAITQAQAHLDHLRAIRDAGGLLTDEGGEPLVLLTSLKGYAGAHYATFPLELVLPLIKAATSEKGCCLMCGGQWVRVVQKPDFSRQPKRTANKLEGEMISKGTQYMTSAGQAWQEWRNQNPDITTGWRPTCTCPPHDPIPAIVLDPFCGSGTVGEACRKLGRRFIGLDLSAEYLAKNAAARAEQMTTEAGLEVARARRPKMDKAVIRQIEAGQLKF